MAPTYLGATVTRRYFFRSVDGCGSLNIGESTLSFKNSRRPELAFQSITLLEIDSHPGLQVCRFAGLQTGRDPELLFL